MAKLGKTVFFLKLISIRFFLGTEFFKFRENGCFIVKNGLTGKNPLAK